MPVLNIAAYQFVALERVEALRAEFDSRARELRLKGTVLLSPEGINLFLAGEERAIRSFQAALAAHQAFAALECKESWSPRQPFARLKVKLKREIIPLGASGVSPAERPAPRLAPERLKQWLDQGRELVLLDTRNAFEVALGSFKGARHLHLNRFRDFLRAAQALPATLKDRPIVTFCTGGIRCEKAAPALIELGFREVYQLDGGILKYFERCGGAHFDGECFVFDQREALDCELKPATPTYTPAGT